MKLRADDHEPLLTLVTCRNPFCFGHVTCHDVLPRFVFMINVKLRREVRDKTDSVTVVLNYRQAPVLLSMQVLMMRGN